ncbi:MAG: DUF4440 domain-containing protein [Gammaproteobacteria bacterium]|nr:MAG: DUF4440 domain-containing protein [Gammaproteobacteria bacterium]TDJ42926.1 MAG: DUF4440 domain-containing protein [Gammaproteobacteria bacterium]
MKLEQALFVNEAFYLAFAQKDLTAMDNLWARDHPVICVHPGWPALTDRAEIMQTWRQILGNPQQPGIDFYDVEGHAVGDSVMVTCYEALPNGVCTASNGFVLEGDEIRMFHHHAGQCVNPPEPSVQERGPLQ